MRSLAKVLCVRRRSKQSRLPSQIGNTAADIGKLQLLRERVQKQLGDLKQLCLDSVLEMLCRKTEEAAAMHAEVAKLRTAAQHEAKLAVSNALLCQQLQQLAS